MNNNNNNNNNLIRCQLCANANGCPSADAVARLFSAEDLLLHIYGHLNYRPHKCSQCDFAAISPAELVQHSQQSMHYQLTLYNAENTFLKELCQYVFDKCRQWNNLARHPLTVPPPSADRRRQSWAKLRLRASSFAKLRLNFELRSANNAPQCSPPQSASPLPSLNSSISEHDEQQPLMNTSANRGVKVKKGLGAQPAGPKRPAPADTAKSASPLPSLSASVKVKKGLGAQPAGPKRPAPADTAKNASPLPYLSASVKVKKGLGAQTAGPKRPAPADTAKSASPLPSLSSSINERQEQKQQQQPVMNTSDGGGSAGHFAKQLNAFTGPNNNSNNVGGGGGGHLSLSVPKQQQNFYAIEKALHDCVMNEVFAPVPGSISAGNTHPPTSSSSTLATAAAVGTNSTSAVVPSTSMQHANVGGIPPALISSNDPPPVKLVEAKFENIKTEPVVAGQQQNGGGCAKRFKTLSKVQCAECDEFLPNSDASRLHHTNVKHLKLCLYMCPVCNKEFMSAFNGPRISIQHIKKQHPKLLLPSKAHVSLADLPEKMAKIRARAVELFGLG
uniref:C2H2-type domain-containing protein n=1 Tax=Globodera rostochiensis TaxID=31243 RepID=A0A914HDC6_GLORO